MYVEIYCNKLIEFKQTLSKYCLSMQKNFRRYLDVVVNLFIPTKFQCDVITNKHEWCRVLYSTKLLRFSHAVHCLIQGFIGSSPSHQMRIEIFHELQCGFVINRPQ